MEVITPDSLIDALKKFRERGDAKWIDEQELDEQTRGIVDEYLEESAGLSQTDIDDILGNI